MGRRIYRSRHACAEQGCREVGHYEHETRREQDESDRYYRDKPWRCTRHTKPDEVLSQDSPLRESVLVASKVRNQWYERELAEYERAVERGSLYASEPNEFIPGLFWSGPGSGSGFQYGPGFKAFAKDFPEGTRLVITARIELPEQTNDKNEEG